MQVIVVVFATQLIRCWILTSLLTPHFISASDQERKTDTAVAVCEKWVICVHLNILVKNLSFICGIWFFRDGESRNCCLLSTNNLCSGRRYGSFGGSLLPCRQKQKGLMRSWYRPTILHCLIPQETVILWRVAYLFLLTVWRLTTHIWVVPHR